MARAWGYCVQSRGLLGSLVPRRVHLESCLLSHNLLHASGWVQLVGGLASTCLGSGAESGSTLFEARLLLIVAGTDISLFIHDFLVEARRIGAESHRRVILNRERSQQGVIYLFCLFSDDVSNRVRLVIVLDPLKTWILLSLFNDLLVGIVAFDF